MNNFIHEEFIKDINICDELINYFNITDENKEEGMSGNVLDYSRKKSTDLFIYINKIENNPLFISYAKNLQTIVNNYINKYKYCNEQESWRIHNTIKIQHYKKNEGYFKWHSERSASTLNNLTRHLVFITYLNNVNDEGETEFYYQNIKIKPEKGKTIIFPADWTHTHKGIASKTEEKYIITGWFNYITSNMVIQN